MTTAAQPINTTGDSLGDALGTAYFERPASLALTFATVPTWRVGKAPAGAVPLPLDDPSFVMIAGYVNNVPAPQDPAYVPQGDAQPGFSWLTGTGSVYPNGDMIAKTGYNPFSVTPEAILEVTAQDLPASVDPYLPAIMADVEYMSGAFNTYPYSQQYGYFEIKAKLPKGAGLWPAFWMMPVAAGWPPENDIMEVLGATPNILYTTLHSLDLATASNNESTQEAFATDTGIDLSASFNQFGCLWDATKVRYYLNRKLVFSFPTPADWNQPFYLIVNLAVGGATSWGGAPDAETMFPATMEVAGVSVWEVLPSGTSNPVSLAP